jgi:hypothetical protein
LAVFREEGHRQFFSGKLLELFLHLQIPEASVQELLTGDDKLTFLDP